MEYLNEIYAFLNTGHNHVIIMTVFIGFVAAAMILRMVTCSAFRTSMLTLKLNSKDIRTREDAAKLRFGMLRTLAADYMRICDKSISRIPTEALVDRQLSSMSMIGWRFVNIMNFVEAIESGMLFVGLILAVVFQSHMFLYGTLAVGAFLLFKIITAFFDFRTAYSILSNNLLIFLEREVGQFYTADTGGALLRLRSDLVEAITRQTAGLQESVGKLSGNLAEAIDKKLTGVNDTVKKSMEDWDKVLANAVVVQRNINEAAGRMLEAVAKLTAVSASFTEGLTDINKSVTGQLAVLTETTASFAAEQKAFLTQAVLIERNQEILEKTYQSYELTLQNLTRQLGDGLGAYLNIHAQTASQAVNDTMAANIEKIAQLIKIGNRQNA